MNEEDFCIKSTPLGEAIEAASVDELALAFIAANKKQKIYSEPLTQLEFSVSDFEMAESVAKSLGYEQTAYTSTSALCGLFCLPENPEYSKGPHTGGCVIKTKELGWMFVQTLEDLHL